MMGKLKVAGELWHFIRKRKKFVILPLILFLVLMAVVVLIFEIPVLTPFIYALF